MKDLLMFFLLSLSIHSYAQKETVLDIRSKETIDKGIFVVVDEPPRFKGGDIKKATFYENTSKFDIAISRENGYTVYFQMIINEDGSITDLEFMNNPSEILANEVKRIVHLMPFWIPGKIGGKTVRVKVIQEITFSSFH